jgi:hypothetical protein
MQSLIKSTIPLLVIDNNTKVQALQDNLFNQYNILPQENFDYLNIALSQNNLWNQADDFVYTAPIFSPTFHSITYSTSNESQERSSLSQEIVAKPKLEGNNSVSNSSLSDALFSNRNKTIDSIVQFSSEMIATKIVRQKMTKALTDNNISYDNVHKVINNFNQNNTQKKSLSQYLSKLILPIVVSLTKIVCNIIDNVPQILALAVTAGCIKYAIKPLIACLFIAAFIKFGITSLVPCLAIAAYGKYYTSQEQLQVWEHLVSSNNHNDQSHLR